MEINKRIAQIIEHYHLEQKDFAQKIGSTPGNISKIINGLTSPGAKILIAILDHYSDISAEWLMRGEGVMLISNLQPEATSVSRREFEKVQSDLKKLQTEISKLKKGN